MQSKRSDAIECGDDFFNTGKSCKNGHYADRRTVSGACVECLKMHIENDKKKFELAKRARGK